MSTFSPGRMNTAVQEQTIEDHLRAQAAALPGRVALTDGCESLTYDSLWQTVRQRAARYDGAGRCVMLRMEHGCQSLVSYFAIHLSGRVAVPLERDVPEEREAEIQALLREADVPDGVADILFTTGTTGRQKGVMVSHGAVLANSENLIGAQGYAPDITFVVNGPLSHIGSLSKVVPTLMAGGTVSLVDGLRDPAALFGALMPASGRSATFLVPSAIRMLLQMYPDELAAAAPHIAFVETGAAPMTIADMERLCRALPRARLYNTYASTETGIIATYDYNACGPREGCLGRPMRHSDIRIGADGHIVCTGRTLMTGYAADEALTRSVLHDGGLHTADLGRLDAQGRLHLTGRSDDVINTGGYKVAPTEVESAAMQTEGVADCLCTSVAHPVMGRALKLWVVTADGSRPDKRRLARALRERLEPYKVPLLYEQTDRIRRTFNGKPDRKSYRED